MSTFKSFSELAAHMSASERSKDIARAKALRKSRSLSNKRPGTGPRVAR